MPNPIQCPTNRPSESVEALIHVATESPTDVRLDATPPVVHDATMTEEMGETATVKTVEHLIDRALGGPFAGPFGLLYELGHGAAGEFRAGREERALYEYDKMRGALAYFEGRSADPAVLREAESNPAFANGLRKGREVEDQNTALCTRITNAVHTTVTEGYASVVSGNDRGSQFARRYESDLCFRHAVDYARGQRDSGGADWPNIQARVAADCRLADASIEQVPMRA